MALLLLVVDEQSVRDRAAAIIRQSGHEVRHAHSFREALDQVQTLAFNVVIADVVLPDGDGLALLPALRQTYPYPEVIMMTGRTDGGEAERAIKSGAWDYIQHPLQIDTITLSLTRALQYQQEKKELGLPVALQRDQIVGNSPAIRESLDLVAQAAACLANVLVSGESGTGKELYAAAIHENSVRAAGNFVVVDCSALPPNIVESVLFGHAKGAYTGADSAHDGLAAQANGGTLFLDEVGELPRDIQNSFLRMIQERRFRPVGGKREIRSDFRLIAATNRNLDTMVEQGLFRADLLYRLRTIAISLPSLRQHKEDIKALALHFVARICEQYGLEMKGFTPEFFTVLARYDWPGNVRELSQALERAIASVGKRPLLYPMDLPIEIRAKLAKDSADSLEEHRSDLADPRSSVGQILPPLDAARAAAVTAVERAYLRDLLAYADGSLNSACTVSGLSRSRLYALLRKHGMSLPRPAKP